MTPISSVTAKAARLVVKRSSSSRSLRRRSHRVRCRSITASWHVSPPQASRARWALVCQLIRRIEIVVSLGQIALILPSHAAVVETRAASRVELDRQIVIRDRVVVVVLVIPGDAAVEVDLPQRGIVLLEFERGGEVGDC